MDTRSKGTELYARVVTLLAVRERLKDRFTIVVFNKKIPSSKYYRNIKSITTMVRTVQWFSFHGQTPVCGLPV